MLVFCVWVFHRITLEFPIDMRNGGEVCYNITEDMRQVLQVLSKTCELNTYYIPTSSFRFSTQTFISSSTRTIFRQVATNTKKEGLCLTTVFMGNDDGDGFCR